MPKDYSQRIANLADLKTEAVQRLHEELSNEYQELRTEEFTVTSVTDLTNLGSAVKAVAIELSTREDVEVEVTPEELAAQVAAADAAVAEVPVPAKAETVTEDLAAEGDEVKADEEVPAKAEETLAAEEAVELAPEDVETGDLGDAATPISITAGGDIPNVPMGSALTDMKQVAGAFISRRGAFRGLSPEGNGEDVLVASIHAQYPEERTLHSDEMQSNMDKINDIASPAAIVASGGLCAPLEPYYGIQVISDAARPVRDALPKFTADRGGVRFLPPPRLSDLTSAIGVTTAAADAGIYGSGDGQTPFKPCLHVTCGEEQTVEIEAIHRCLTFGNFAARTYPEQVEAWLALAIAAHARRAETLLLDAIDAASVATTAGATYSAARSLLPQLDVAVAAYRSRNRTSQNLSLRILLPAWTRELLRADLARSFKGNDLDPLSVSDAQIDGWFALRNVNPSFYIDSSTSGGQIFGAQSTGALTPFPSTVVWYLFVEGSFVFLDGGTLDLGLVRDSTLNKTNDYQIFAETFEAVAFYGIESIKVTSTLCPNGVSAPIATSGLPC